MDRSVNVLEIMVTHSQTANTQLGRMKLGMPRSRDSVITISPRWFLSVMVCYWVILIFFGCGVSITTVFCYCGDQTF